MKRDEHVDQQKKMARFSGLTAYNAGKSATSGFPAHPYGGICM